MRHPGSMHTARWGQAGAPRVLTLTLVRPMGVTDRWATLDRQTCRSPPRLPHAHKS